MKNEIEITHYFNKPCDCFFCKKQKVNSDKIKKAFKQAPMKVIFIQQNKDGTIEEVEFN